MSNLENVAAFANMGAASALSLAQRTFCTVFRTRFAVPRIWCLRLQIWVSHPASSQGARKPLTMIQERHCSESGAFPIRRQPVVL